MRRFIFIFTLLLPAVVFAGEVVKVKVQKSSIFEEPKFFSRVVSPVSYGDELEMLDQLRDWSYVKYLEQNGWIRKSGLTSTKVDLGTILVGGSSDSATEDEVALAGKGFTPEVERGYEETHPEVNYALVDQIERYHVEDESLYRFIEQGGLTIKKGE